MRPLAWPRLTATLLCSAACGLAGASQSFLFPVEQIEGLFATTPPEPRPLVDDAMRAMLIQDDSTRQALAQRLRETLLQQLQAAYPGNIVNGAQVSTTRAGGAPAYLPEVSCGTGFRAPLAQSYAVVVGLSRASLYKVKRIGGDVELLAPVTLNLQLIKPDAGKIVYSLSDTQYVTLRRRGTDVDTPAGQAALLDALKASMPAQVAALVAELKQAFQPKETLARVLGAEQNAFVIDKGYESGLKEGEQIEVTHRASGREVGMQVLSTASGYSVVRPTEGSFKTGDELLVTTGAAADDSRKPRVLPVVGQGSGQAWSAGVAELFTKQIGFKAPFQILPVDTNFSSTMRTMNDSLRCLDEGAKKALKQVSGGRGQEPNFFLRFERGDSPTFRLAGLGNVETRDTFITSLSAQLVDERGDVIFSALGSDTYRLERTAGQGLAIEQAKEISLKNATLALTRQVLATARLDGASFRIDKVDGNRIRVPGLVLPAGEAVAFEVLRPMKVRVGANAAVRKLAVEAGGAAPTVDGAATLLEYVSNEGAEPDDKPRAGDDLRVLNLPAAGQARYTECRSPYQASNGSIAADDLLPLIRHASYGSALYKVNVATPEFVADANALMRSNAFSTALQPFPATETCLRAAYLVRQEPPRCETPASCVEQVKVAPAVILTKAGARAATYSQSDALNLEGFGESQAAGFAGLKAHEHLLKTLSALTTSLNTKK